MTRNPPVLSSVYKCLVPRGHRSTTVQLCVFISHQVPTHTKVFSQESLSYQCICSNKVSPNASEYSQTLPYYVCTETNNQCVNKCANGDSGCQSACRQDNPCGAQNPKRMNVTTTASAAATSTTQANPLGTNPATGGASCMNILEAGHVYGLCVLVGGFVAGLAVFL